MLHVHAACPCCMSVLHVCAARPCYMSMLHFRAECPCCISTLHVHTACQYCMSIWHVHAAWTCSMSTRHFNAACYMSKMHFKGVYPSRISCRFSMQHVHAAFPCCIYMVHVLAAFPCVNARAACPFQCFILCSCVLAAGILKVNLHVRAACLCCMSMPHIRVVHGVRGVIRNKCAGQTISKTEQPREVL